MKTSGKSCREKADVRHILPCHVPRMRGIQYAAASRFYRCRLWNTGSPGPGYANHLRPKADFGGQEATPRLRCAGAPKL
jgi:hypothetical protein